jgi:hypothetical protein
VIIGSIKDNNYYEGVPDTSSLPVPSPLVKVGEIESQRFDRQWELLQPYLADGTVNPEFVSMYPEESETYGFLPAQKD